MNGQKVFKILCALFLVIFLSICLVLALLWVKPGVLVNETTLRWAQQKFFPEYKIPWDQLNLSLQKKSLGVYSIGLNGKDFCLDLKDYGEACFDQLDVKLEVALNLHELKSIRLVSLTARDQKIQILIPQSSSPQPNPSSKGFDWEALRERLKKVHLGTLDVVLDQTTIALSGKSIPVNLELNESLKFDVNMGNLAVAGQILPKSKTNYSLDLHVDSSAFSVEVQGEASLVRKDSYALQGSVTFKPKSKSLTAYLGGFSTNFEVALDKDLLHINLDSLNARIHQKPLTGITATLCQASINLESSPKEKIPIDCSDIRLKFGLSQIKMKDLPKELSLDLHMQMPMEWIRKSPLTSEETLFVQTESKPIHRSFFDFFFKAETGVYHDENGWNLKEPDVSARLLIQKFEDLVNALKNTNYAIPAPFYQMKGSLEAKIVEIPKRSQNKFEIPFQVISDLKDTRNAVVGQVHGSFTYPRDLQLKVSVDQFHIQLPPFDPVRGVPPLVLDSRIKPTLKSEEEKKPALPLNLSVSVETTRPDSIRVYYSLLDPYASFGMKAELNKELTFQVSKSAQPFDINYLKRSVTVLSLKLTQADENKPIRVNGKLLYRATGYNIYIDFSGPMDKPEVVLSSDPPLDRRDIISVLLYNRVSSDIASFEQENVGGTEAALTDRAVGLFGLWAFASTPIESVSYNSVTKTYSAQIKLPQGFRFSIGTNWENVQNLELRRRLRGNWFVSTIYRPETDQEQGRGEIMLQRKTSY